MEREAYLREVTLGELAAHSGKIPLAPYDSRWPEQFRREEEKIRRALGDAALAVEHVGSTSVPGLCAKPILDILLLVADAAQESGYAPALKKVGYILRIREPDWFQHRMFRGTVPAVNLHVFPLGSPEAARMLRFRDWLRTHERDRNLYACEKRRLAEREWRYVQDYADAKTEVIREILEHAGADLPPEGEFPQ